ncbi:MAG TPA: hypothetical protein VFI25_03995 [Planctomycetota bacterium]|jgi:hypothetical protein|nr:hypothetical protein [Planctomycetota bacterium]
MKNLLPALSLLAPLLLPLGRSAGDADVRALLPDAQGIQPVEVRISEADEEAIARAVGRSPAGGGVVVRGAAAPAPAIEVYRTRAKVEDEPRDLRVALVPAKGPKGGFRLAVAVDGEGIVRAAKALGDAGGAGSDKFLSQFLGEWATAHAGAATPRPLSALEEKRNAAKGEGPEAKKLRTLFALRGLMVEDQAAADAIEQALGKKEAASAVPHAKRIAENLGKIAALGADLPPILEGKEVASFVEFAEATRKVAEELVQALEKGDAARATNLSSTALQQSCARCHGFDDHRYRKPLTSAFEKLREEAGIGSGYFVVGHDVVPVPGEEAASQAAAFAVKEAILVLGKTK